MFRTAECLASERPLEQPRRSRRFIAGYEQGYREYSEAQSGKLTEPSAAELGATAMERWMAPLIE